MSANDRHGRNVVWMAEREFPMLGHISGLLEQLVGNAFSPGQVWPHLGASVARLRPDSDLRATTLGCVFRCRARWWTRLVVGP